MKRKNGKISKAIFLIFNDPYLFLKLVKSYIAPLPKSPVKINMDGILFECDFDFDPVMKRIYHGVHDVDLVNMMRKILKKGDTFIDIGACFGYLSSVAMGLVGKDGQVHSFEPAPINFQRLKNIAVLNSEYKIEVNQCALGDKEAKALINISNNLIKGWNTLVPDFMDKGAIRETIEIDVRRLDAYIKNKGLRNISLIKIDTEGYEFPILRGLSGYLDNTPERPVIICEIAPQAYPFLRNTLEQFSEYMRKYGYRAYSPVDTNVELDITRLETTTDVVFMNKP